MYGLGKEKGVIICRVWDVSIAVHSTEWRNAQCFVLHVLLGWVAQPEVSRTFPLPRELPVRRWFPSRRLHCEEDKVCEINFSSHYEKLSIGRQCKTKWGFAPHFWADSFEKVAKFSLPTPPPALPLSRSCQTPKVINPNVMITAVVLRKSVNKPLSIMVGNSWCESAWPGGGGGGGSRPLTKGKATCSWHVRRKIFTQGINSPNERFSSWQGVFEIK